MLEKNLCNITFYNLFKVSESFLNERTQMDGMRQCCDKVEKKGVQPNLLGYHCGGVNSALCRSLFQNLTIRRLERGLLHKGGSPICLSQVKSVASGTTSICLTTK